MLPMNLKEQNGKARLLCVDDDPRFLILITAVLELAGYSAVAISAPHEALELATNASFDLAIVDYDMPEMNGAELARRLKQHKCDLPVILFSGNPSLPADALTVVDEHVVKGEGVELLLQVLSARFLLSTNLEQLKPKIERSHSSFCLGQYQRPIDFSPRLGL